MPREIHAKRHCQRKAPSENKAQRAMHARGARTLVFPCADLSDDTGNPKLLAAPVALLQPSVHQ
eukprot:3450792-Rhodomonas_salina.1